MKSPPPLDRRGGGPLISNGIHRLPTDSRAPRPCSASQTNHFPRKKQKKKPIQTNHFAWKNQQKSMNKSMNLNGKTVRKSIKSMNIKDNV